jgi:CRP-like cAMP-binding protein
VATDSPQTFGNRVLDGLPERLQDLLAPMLHPVLLQREDPTNEQRHPITHVYFPVDAVMSLLARSRTNETAEVALIGRDGFVEIDAALDSRVAERRTICRIPGTALRMSVDAFQATLEQERDFARIVRRATRATIFVTQQLAMCNANHAIIERVARWLLMVHDYSAKPNITITQENIAASLGVRRAGVTTVLGGLRNAGAIANERGMIVVVDARRLETFACECYDVSRAAIERTFDDDSTG